MHTAAFKWQAVPVDSARWLALTGWDSLVRWPVPVFVMITGALFLPRKTSVRDALCRYVPRMALAYLIWAAIYALHSAGPGAEFRELVNAAASGHYHLWYLPFLCGVYLMLPFLQKIAEDEKLTAQLLGLSLVIAQGIPGWWIWRRCCCRIGARLCGRWKITCILPSFLIFCPCCCWAICWPRGRFPATRGGSSAARGS